MNLMSFSRHAGGANTPQPVPFVPPQPLPPTQPLLDTPPPQIEEPPRPGHYPLLGGARPHWH
ncbi:hypothetical protein LRS03_25670 [Rhizobacter sp. J219]|jgi:hypothetical protein|uniref:hypothetical protein n=1 Tax=Rhizobacter sp. J219 TaxID=2898430 RepID=UPI002150FCD7|nr:hypothetical protein [Rhizobacter sp. J219]MCR5886053.1 hypothetical protein [Rhizobacter sp. J219]